LFSKAAKFIWAGHILVALTALVPGPLLAQATPPASEIFQARIDDAIRILATEPRFQGLSPQKRRAVVEFVVGNMLFVMAHELGHAVMGEMEMPVLGREEDAADTFAILNALRLANNFSHRVIVEAAKGWFLSARRDKKEGNLPDYYGKHGLDEQRAYQIVCLMVGSDPLKFRDLADEMKLPMDRQKSCQGDYRNAAWSWETLLMPHRRSADQPRQTIEGIYSQGDGRLDVYARLFRGLRFLETVAENAADRFVWPRSFAIEMRSCRAVGARWDGESRRIELCYEIAEEFAQVYLDFGQDQKRSKPKRKH